MDNRGSQVTHWYRYRFRFFSAHLILFRGLARVIDFAPAPTHTVHLNVTSVRARKAPSVPWRKMVSIDAVVDFPILSLRLNEIAPVIRRMLLNRPLGWHSWGLRFRFRLNSLSMLQINRKYIRLRVSSSITAITGFKAAMIARFSTVYLHLIQGFFHCSQVTWIQTLGTEPS